MDLPPGAGLQDTSAQSLVTENEFFFDKMCVKHGEGTCRGLSGGLEIPTDTLKVSRGTRGIQC